jgi:signal transduction histidine kinase
MERANAANDPTAFAEAAAAARQALAESEPVQRQAVSLAEAVERQRRLWGEFTEISCVIDVADEPTPTALRAVDLIVEEGIANAKKHGRSTHIALAIDRVSGGIRICITDDGRGPREGPPGYGSTLLDRAAPGGWRLTAGDAGGAILTAVVPDD